MAVSISFIPEAFSVNVIFPYTRELSSIRLCVAYDKLPEDMRMASDHTSGCRISSVFMSVPVASSITLMLSDCKDSESREQCKGACSICIAEAHPILWKDSESREQCKGACSICIAEAHPFLWKDTESREQCKALARFALPMRSCAGRFLMTFVAGVFLCKSYGK